MDRSTFNACSITAHVHAALVAVTATLALTSAAHAQWAVTNLNPAGATESRAYAAFGGQQAGSATVGGVRRASLWSGTAASWIDLSPVSATDSVTQDAFCRQQTGYATVGGVRRASLWSGTAASWVDLNPAGSTDSAALAAAGGQQAGNAVVGGVYHASLWSGTAASWVDLHAFLPAGFTSSEARGISSDGVNTYVTGYGFNSITNRTEALLWTQHIPNPGACCNTKNGQCFLLTAPQCSGVGLRFDGAGSACSATTCRACPADFNSSGIISVQDIFDFLAAYFAGCP